MSSLLSLLFSMSYEAYLSYLEDLYWKLFWIGFIVGELFNIIASYFFAKVMNDIKEEKGCTKEYHFWALSFWLGLFGWVIVYMIVSSLPDFMLRKETLISNGNDTVIGNEKGTEELKRKRLLDELTRIPK